MKAFRGFFAIAVLLAFASIGTAHAAPPTLAEFERSAIAAHQEVSASAIDIASLCTCEVAVAITATEVNALFARCLRPLSTVVEHSLTAKAAVDLRRPLNFESKRARNRQHWRG